MSIHGNVKSEIELLINGKRLNAVIRSADTMLRVLREQLGLTGAKEGCENGDCGACTIIIDEAPIKSCLMLAIEAQGCSITSIEGLRDTPIQRAFIDKFAFQCGFCTPGFIMVCQALINHQPNASQEVIEQWLQSNICRCTSYEEIGEAIRSVMINK
jgi:carbon-monoxide dehydrogenase small subunit